MGAFAQGNGDAWTSPVLPHISNCREDCDFDFSRAVGSWIASVFPLGCVTSILLGSYLMDRVGRKRAMMWMTAPFVLGWLLLLLPVPLGLAEDSAAIMLIAGRYLTGGFYIISKGLDPGYRQIYLLTG